MLKLPGSADQFLERYWQKEPLFLPQALDCIRPAITRNELGWLATLEDVESRLVFTERGGERVRYSAESGPFEPHYLEALPKRDWTLLVHDVEKHLPAMRLLFAQVPFVPDWRIDDLMVSFAAPGGGVGPHRDNYDVFLCQGIGRREWHVTTEDVAEDPHASDDLALTAPFTGTIHAVGEGDVIYLPPGVTHWGTATRACMTYSIGMRAPQLSDLLSDSAAPEHPDRFYTDPNLRAYESIPGYISRESLGRVMEFAGFPDQDRTGKALGKFVTQTKDWITPDGADDQEALSVAKAVDRGVRLSVHGMARIAWDDRHVYANGACRARSGLTSEWLEALCATRSLPEPKSERGEWDDWLNWLLRMGTFDLPEVF